MSDNLMIEFTDVKTEFDKEFITGLLDSIFHGTKVIKIDRHGNIKSLDGFVKILLKERRIEFPIPSTNYGMGLSVINGTGTRVSFSVHEQAVIGESANQVIAYLVQVSKRVYSHIHPAYGRGDFGLIFDKYGNDVNEGGLYKKRVFWLNFYGKQLVKEIGESKFTSVPYGHVEKLNDGGVLLMRGKGTNDNLGHIEDIRRHLFGK